MCACLSVFVMNLWSVCVCVCVVDSVCGRARVCVCVRVCVFFFLFLSGGFLDLYFFVDGVVDLGTE